MWSWCMWMVFCWRFCWCSFCNWVWVRVRRLLGFYWLWWWFLIGLYCHLFVVGWLGCLGCWGSSLTWLCFLCTIWRTCWCVWFYCWWCFLWYVCFGSWCIFWMRFQNLFRLGWYGWDFVVCCSSCCSHFFESFCFQNRCFVDILWY